MMLMPSRTPRAAVACQARSATSYITGRFSSGSPPKKVSRNRSGATRSSSRLDPAGHPRRRLERHLLGELVVVAVIALEAVVAREVALQRRENGDVQLGAVALDRREVLVERPAVGVAVGDEEAVLLEQIERVALSRRRRSRSSSPDSIEQRGDVRRHDELRVGQRVHQEHVVAPVERHTKVEHGGLHQLHPKTARQTADGICGQDWFLIANTVEP